MRALSVALVIERELVWGDGFGELPESGVRPTADTVFAAASLSKPPFAHAVLRLCRRGAFDLDVPLAELVQTPYEPWALDPEWPHLGEVTARHVLSHTSGLGNWDERDRGRVGFRPGSAWLYSGDGYLYLQAAVERVVGSSLEGLMRVEVLGPLEMRSSDYRWRRRSPPAAGHELPRAFASHSLHTTAHDYARFVVDTMCSEVGRALLEQQVAVDDSLSWGLGWGGADHVFWQWGELRDFESVAVGSREEGRALVVLTAGGGGLRAASEIATNVLGADYARPIEAVLARGW